MQKDLWKRGNSRMIQRLANKRLYLKIVVGEVNKEPLQNRLFLSNVKAKKNNAITSRTYQIYMQVIYGGSNLIPIHKNENFKSIYSHNKKRIVGRRAA